MPVSGQRRAVPERPLDSQGMSPWLPPASASLSRMEKASADQIAEAETVPAQSEKFARCGYGRRGSDRNAAPWTDSQRERFQEQLVAMSDAEGEPIDLQQELERALDEGRPEHQMSLKF